MSTHRLAWTIVLLSAAVAGCNKENSLFCCTTVEACSRPNGSEEFVYCTDPERPFCDNEGEYPASNGTGRTCIPNPFGDAGMRDAGIDGGPACQESSECTAPTEPICDGEDGFCRACTAGSAGDAECAAKDGATPRCASTGACVECLTSGDCASPAEPVCDTSAGTCRPCQDHDECGSGVCDDAAGECVPPGDIVHVATTGADGPGCGAAGSPCLTIGGAQGGLAKVTTTRRWVLVAPGSYTGAVVVSNLSFHMIASGADLTRGTVGPVIDISGASTVIIEGLRVHDGPGATGDGLRCAIDGADIPTVTLLGVTIDANNGQGIDASSCVLTVQASRLFTNTGGGISLTDSEFTIINNFIAKNGSVASTLGGVLINQISAAGTHRFEFNTVTDNGGAAGVHTGVACSLVTVPLAFASSIAYGNQTSSGGAQVGGDPDCAWTYSDIGPENQTGTGNINLEPTFVDEGANDYHLQAGSDGVDLADPAATVVVDIDGDTRPQNGRADMGADEVLP